jgi:geranylgeranyl pyrophosphate synthase
MRPTLPLAVAYERAKGKERELVDGAWRRSSADKEKLRSIIEQLAVIDRCRGLLDSYKEEAIRSLTGLENASLKGLLRRVVSKIFTLEVKGWCSEFEARNASGREAGAHAVG